VARAAVATWRDADVMGPAGSWPATADELIEAQEALGRQVDAATRAAPWRPAGDEVRVGGCFVTLGRDRHPPGVPAWGAAVTWCPAHSPFRRAGVPFRRSDAALRTRSPGPGPRRAADVDDQALVAGRVTAPYAPGLLALRHGALLSDAVGALDPAPDVLLVDATGLDHPRRAGLAVHLGAVLDLPTVGVTRRPLVAVGDPPPLARGARTPLTREGEVVAHWVCTRTGARPVVAHAAWRTDPDAAVALVLLTSTEAARTPVPVQEARRVAREARALGEAR